VHASVRWLRGRVGELGVDASRIVAWGKSAGAHLAALLGLTGGRRDADGPSGAVAGVVDWYGAADLTTMAAQAMPTAIARSDDPDSRESQLLGVPVGEAPELARRASPVNHVHPAAPPFHIAHGGFDRFVPVAQSRQLADSLRGAGCRGRVHGGARRRSSLDEMRRTPRQFLAPRWTSPGASPQAERRDTTEARHVQELPLNPIPPVARG
jgi:acetyl esterase/lipase